MYAIEIEAFRQRLEKDPDYRELRRSFHEAYEWLEGYWLQQGWDLDRFCRSLGSYYWRLEGIRDAARRFAGLECVGNSRHVGEAQTEGIAAATMHLRYRAGLFDAGAEPSCDSLACRPHKRRTGLCRPAAANHWENGATASFKALMHIVRQVRNNMFHGNKMNLEPVQFERDRRLVGLAANVTHNLLEGLGQAEASIGNGG